MCEEDITRRVRDTHEPLIAYWDRIRLALMTLSGDTRTTLIQGFWPVSSFVWALIALRGIWSSSEHEMRSTRSQFGW